MLSRRDKFAKKILLTMIKGIAGEANRQFLVRGIVTTAYQIADEYIAHLKPIEKEQEGEKTFNEITWPNEKQNTTTETLKNTQEATENTGQLLQ